jgi:hypothetical protein
MKFNLFPSLTTPKRVMQIYIACNRNKAIDFCIGNKFKLNPDFQASRMSEIDLYVGRRERIEFRVCGRIVIINGKKFRFARRLKSCSGEFYV